MLQPKVGSKEGNMKLNIVNDLGYGYCTKLEFVSNILIEGHYDCDENENLNPFVDNTCHFGRGIEMPEIRLSYKEVQNIYPHLKALLPGGLSALAKRFLFFASVMADLKDDNTVMVIRPYSSSIVLDSPKQRELRMTPGCPELSEVK